MIMHKPMAAHHMAAALRLNGSVGLEGLNFTVDVGKVQGLLKARGLYQGRPDNRCGPKTIDAIRKFQAHFLREPDGLIEPKGITWKKLTGQVPMGAPLPPQTIAAASSLSQKGYWFIYHIEVGGLFYLTKSLHWPKGKSGVTIGPGYDMRERKSDQIKRDLLQIGLSNDVATTFSKGAGLLDDDADNFCKTYKHLASLTKDQHIAIMRLIAPQYISDVNNRMKVPLKQHEFDALVSYFYNPGKDGKTRTINFINEGKIEEAMEVIRTRVSPETSDTHKGLVIRRKKEIDLFRNGVYADVTEA